jgi:hypothetical protein
VSEKDLLEFAARTIGERAAVPKAVHIVTQMPVTAVGKIFKPALVAREIEDVVRQEAATAGADIDSVSIVSDARRGVVARVCTRQSPDVLRSALGRYTFALEIVAEQGENR